MCNFIFCKKNDAVLNDKDKQEKAWLTIFKKKENVLKTKLKHAM